VGAGISGICSAVLLTRAGFECTVFEQSEGPGGTWWDNTYPGCEVDGPSLTYSFSFMQYDWSGTHAKQPELQQYAEDMIDRFGIRDCFRFSTRVDAAVWDEARSLYRVRLARGEELDFEAVVSCLGILNYPRYPDWPGLESFRGPKFHSSRWEHDVDLAGKTVAFVGTGSTAAQAVPNLAETAGRLYLFQRSPGWVLPKGERQYTPEERERFRRSPLRWRIARLKMYRDQTRLVTGLFRPGTPVNDELEATARCYLESEIHDPELRAALTPDFPVGCKRIVLASTYYPALNRENVTLVPHAVERVTEDGIVATDGVERKVDVLIMATGFQPANFLASLEITGYGGRTIHEAWDGNPRALLGLTMPGFPNFFMCYGPNTNGGPGMMWTIERQARAIVRMLRRLERRRGKAIDTRPAALDRYVAWVDRENRERLTAKFANCTNYDFAPSGRLVLPWPRSGAYYDLMTRVVPPFAMLVRR
jgi:cation diffusion facilitator CzcD-associated flavoprotein CzcO